MVEHSSMASQIRTPGELELTNGGNYPRFVVKLPNYPFKRFQMLSGCKYYIVLKNKLYGP